MGLPVPFGRRDFFGDFYKIMSWMQQREAIRRAADAGTRPRISAQGSQLLPLRDDRLRSQRVTLESGQSFEPRELLKHTRLCSAITYASVQGLTLRGRVWLCDVDFPFHHEAPLHGLLPGHQLRTFERFVTCFKVPWIERTLNKACF